MSRRTRKPRICQASVWLVSALLLGCASKSAAPAKDVSYRLVEASCSRCNSLEQYAAERVSRAAVDCGTAVGPNEETRVVACIAEAQAAGRPFQATVDASSPQRTVRSVFLGTADGQKLELRYDSGPGGGKLACGAGVSEQTCSAIAGRGDRIVCTGPTSGVQSLCDETGLVHKKSLRERPVSELTCTGELEKHGAENVAWIACRRRTDGPAAVLPLPVVCHVLLRDPDEMICFEQAGWEADDTLGGVR